MVDDLDVEAMLEAPFHKGQEIDDINGKTEKHHKEDMKNDDVTEVLHILLVIVIDHIPGLVVHVDHALDHEYIESVGVSPGRVKDEEEVELVLVKKERGAVVHVEEVAVEGRRRRSPTPPLDEEERDKRTVFVMQLAARLRSRELADFFANVGKVRDAKIIADRISRRSKGVGYVEFYDEESVPKALALTGQKLLGIPVIVQLTEAEKNRQARLAEQAASHATDIAYHRLYVGSVHFNLTEDDLRQVFEPFGPLEFVNLHKDPETGRSRGFAFIQYKNPEDAKQALEKMNGFELAGRTIKVGLVTDKSNGMNLNLDDGDVAGLALNAQSRVELMQKLARDTDLIAPAATPVQSEPPRPVQPRVNPTRCVLLKNMFNPEEETESNWAEELEEDVKGECVKYGPVVHISVDRESAGDIYMKFDSVSSAQAAVNGLNGRWFGGNQISAVFILDMFYNEGNNDLPSYEGEVFAFYVRPGRTVEKAMQE
ncbi:12938_t:CDS:10 [Funneliformis geosporum]|uniref:8634_t:CDS:1 n=1 Tax=Funneliformis geosporum TaxID=1117311 RepID=A0A9W4SVM0_9GLOM|nr:12938_t:CDS:10 [Funneliformis geosporum]CAI2182296.1 8634_t:CDS:10 [Funneliformis geosporum]